MEVSNLTKNNVLRLLPNRPTCCEITCLIHNFEQFIERSRIGGDYAAHDINIADRMLKRLIETKNIFVRNDSVVRIFMRNEGTQTIPIANYKDFFASNDTQIPLNQTTEPMELWQTKLEQEIKNVTKKYHKKLLDSHGSSVFTDESDNEEE